MLSAASAPAAVTAAADAAAPAAASAAVAERSPSSVSSRGDQEAQGHSAAGQGHGSAADQSSERQGSRHWLVHRKVLIPI